MKALLFLAARKTDLSCLIARFPEVFFVIATSVQDFAEHIVDADILVTWTADYSREISAAARTLSRNLKWIQFATSGIDGAIKNGGLPPNVVVTNCAGLRAPNLSEHAFMLLFFLARRMRTFEAFRDRREWGRSAVAGGMMSFRNSTALIVGMGAIGQAIARRARAFEMKVIAVSRAYRPDDLVDETFVREDALPAFARADVVFLCLPSDGETRGYVDHAKLRAMKESAYLINVSRGDVIAEDDLVDACRNGVIAGAGLDVMTTEPLRETSPLWTLDNVALTPHVGGTGKDETEILVDMISENFRRYLEGRPLVRMVDI